MKNFKFTVVMLAVLTLSMTAQASTYNTTNIRHSMTEPSISIVKKARTLHVVKSAIKLPAPRQVSTHTTRSVLFYTPAETRTKVIGTNTAFAKTPNLFKD